MTVGRGGKASASRRWRHRQDLSGGLLESEQRLEWRGPLPAPPRMEQFPELFAAAHFAEVERSVAGLLRCRRAGPRIECRLWGRWPGLIFAEDGVTRGAYAVTVRWRILGGWLARPGETEMGALLLGFTAIPVPGQDAWLTVWARVEGYPSRFLGAPGQGGRRWGCGLVGELYAAYHRRVTFRYLHRVAGLLEAAG